MCYWSLVALQCIAVFEVIINIIYHTDSPAANWLLFFRGKAINGNLITVSWALLCYKKKATLAGISHKVCFHLPVYKKTTQKLSGNVRNDKKNKTKENALKCNRPVSASTTVNKARNLLSWHLSHRAQHQLKKYLMIFEQRPFTAVVKEFLPTIWMKKHFQSPAGLAQQKEIVALLCMEIASNVKYY